MYLLDADVLSALMSARPPPEVAAWVSARHPRQLHTASVCQAEILAGLAVMPEGRRRLDLEAAARAVFEEDFEGRVLPFDMAAAEVYAAVFAARRRAGRPAKTLGLVTAATIRAHGAAVVIRNAADFELCGVEVVNPWAAPATG
jgi:toxin FitB